MLEHYSGRLNAVEINGTFYRSAQPSVLSGWAEATPAGFQFCFKGNRGITYSAAAFDKAGLARDFAARVGVLGERCGPVLVQFPPTSKQDHGLLDSVLEALAVPAALEFRDESWFSPEVFRVLERRGAALVVTDQDKWPRAPELDGPLGYYRLRRDYEDAELEPWAALIGDSLRRRDDVYVFFKHETEGPARALRVLEVASGG